MTTNILRSLRAIAASVLLLASLTPLIAFAATPPTPEFPPPYVGMTLDGEPVSLAAYAGKAVVVTFWATWCPYCLKELPILNGIRKASKGGIHVIAVNTEKREVFRHVVRALGKLDLELTYDPGDKAQQAYGVKGIPHMVIIGRDGRTVAVHRGYDESALDRIVADLNRAAGAAP